MNPYLQNILIKIPSYIYRTHDLMDMVSRIYPPQLLSYASQDPTVFTKAAILTIHNSTVDEINQIVLDRLPGASHVFNSADTADVSNTDDCGEVFLVSSEYMKTLNPGNFPPSKLTLKVGVVVMLLRNLNQKKGLCNGTRLIVHEIKQHVLVTSILRPSGSTSSEYHLMPRIKLSTLEGELPFILTCKQFPIRLCFAMTIKKAQGQSLQNVGIDLRYEVLTHGQLYVALSRATSWKNVTVLFGEDNKEETTRNIVYHELSVNILKS